MVLELENPLLEAVPCSEGGERKVGSDWRYNPRVSIFNLLGSIPTLLLVIIIKTYQFTISPLLGQNCRFNPTCSEYAIQSLSKKGFFMGFLLSVYRVLRCNPFSSGGNDPVL